MHAANPTEKTVNLDAIAAFWQQEAAGFEDRNRVCAARRAESDAATGEKIVVTCMDERNTHLDEALGFAPGEAQTYASGGGKIDLATFEAAFGARIDAAASQGLPVSVFLVPHECSHDAGLGCAAFANDTEAQKAFFTAFKAALKDRFPSAAVHVAALCTTTHKLREIDTDAADEALRSALEHNATHVHVAEDVQHAGHGIYVGDAYRAWVPKRNAYFNLSAANPSIAGNAAIALTVMEHHSAVDLSTKPVVIHVDYPRYADAAKTETARTNIDAAVAEILGSAAFNERAGRGLLKIVKTETDVATWQGRLLE